MCGNNRENNSRDVRIVYPLTKRRSERVWRNPDSRDSVKKEKKIKKESRSFTAASCFRTHYSAVLIVPYLRSLSRVSDFKTSVPHHTEISGIIPRTALELAVRLGVPRRVRGIISHSSASSFSSCRRCSRSQLLSSGQLPGKENHLRDTLIMDTPRSYRITGRLLFISVPFLFN